MNQQEQEIIDSIKDTLSDNIKNIYEFRGETSLTIEKEKLLEICKRLIDEYRFIYLADLTAVDYLEVKIPRFEMVYYLHRFDKDYEGNTRIRIKVELSGDEPEIDSVTSLWKGADWLEREVYDMFGINFKGHPDLRRILMPEDYEEFPLRKDFDVRNREPSKKSFQNDLISGNN